VHILLTDVLTCPRCGPDFGLVLLAREIRERRVLEGALGCANCREEYPVTEGFADLRFPPGNTSFGSADPPATGEEDTFEPVHLAALLGVTEGPALLLLQGPASRSAEGVAELLDDVEIAAVASTGPGRGEAPGVSRMAAGPRLPFRSEVLRGAFLSGEVRVGEVEEAVRVVAPGARVVVLPASGGIRDSLEAAGLEILVEEDGALVAEKGPSRGSPLVPLRGPDGKPTLP
jgi:uncharacterized protein YbaR (Trm112 family)